MRNFISHRIRRFFDIASYDEECDYTTHTQKIIPDGPVLRLVSGHPVHMTEIQD